MYDRQDRLVAVVQNGFYERVYNPTLDTTAFSSGQMVQDFRNDVFNDALAANNEIPSRAAIFLDGTIQPPTGNTRTPAPYYQPKPLPGTLVSIHVTCKEAVTPDLKFVFVDSRIADFQADPHDTPSFTDSSVIDDYVGEPVLIAAADYSSLSTVRIAMASGIQIPVPDVYALSIAAIANGSFTLAAATNLIFRFSFLL